MHFAYLEDMDLAWRAKLAGFRNYYEPEAKVVHIGSGTTGGRHNEFKVRMSARNNIYMIRKNMPAWQKVINAPFLFAGTLIKYLYFKKKNLSAAYIKGLKEGFSLPVHTVARPGFFNQMHIQFELWGNVFKRRH